MPRRADIRIALTVALLGSVLSVITAFEHMVFGWHFAREVAPGDSEWHWLRSAVTALLSFAAIASVAAAGNTTHGEKSAVERSGGLVPAWLVLAMSVILTGLLLADPSSYRAAGEEDGLIEWASFAALMAGSAFCAFWTVEVWRSSSRTMTLVVFAAAGFAALFFVMGMEEISWGQRVFGFETPEGMKAENWQGEFNLHNMQTDIAEFALYGATGLFLVILPLVSERLGSWRLVAPFAGMLPGRSVALVSAPMLAFTYARWDLLPIQAIYFGGLATCVVFAHSAGRAGRGREAVTFCAVACFLVAGQAVHLLAGHTMTQIYDETEFREAILSFGICWFGWSKWRSVRGLAGNDRLTPSHAPRKARKWQIPRPKRSLHNFSNS